MRNFHTTLLTRAIVSKTRHVPALGDYHLHEHGMFPNLMTIISRKMPNLTGQCKTLFRIW
jgi:hypothetical protein